MDAKQFISRFSDKNLFSNFGLALTAILIGLFSAGFVVWQRVCPCGNFPGGNLTGKTNAELITDWGFANTVRLCQIQVSAPIIPHSVNVNCFASEAGDLFVNCAECESKYWSRRIELNPESKIRLGGELYPVNMRILSNDVAIAAAWQARLEKFPEGRSSSVVLAQASPPEGWRPVKVESRSINSGVE